MKYLTIRGETKMNEIINAIPEYVITLVVSTAIVYAFKYLESLIHAKALHAKTTQSKELWSFIEQVADTVVSSLVNAQMSGNDKFNQATTIVQEVLAKRGFTNVDMKAIESAVQAAYEKSDLTGNDTTDPVKVAIQTAPNRANDLTKEDN